MSKQKKKLTREAVKKKIFTSDFLEALGIYTATEIRLSDEEADIFVQLQEELLDVLVKHKSKMAPVILMNLLIDVVCKRGKLGPLKYIKQEEA